MATTPVDSASDIQANYMNLLITQLRNQNPLEPMDNSQMATQLAQLSQLQQLEGMNNSFDKVLLTEQINQATSLIGKTVTFIPEGGDTSYIGTVSKVGLTDGKVTVNVGSYKVDPSTITTIQ